MFIKLEINVWKASSPADIIELFFGELRKVLGPQSFDLDRNLSSYSKQLIENVESDRLRILHNLLNIFSPNKTLQDQFEIINEELKKMEKAIVITIDDLDRLDTQEIYEVIRLIRNTANFANVTFIVPYDRNYLSSALAEINKHHPERYLEKIFQVEFALPQEDFEEIRKFIMDKLSDFVNNDDLQELNQNLYKLHHDPDQYYAPLEQYFIFNIREAVKFINSLKLIYELLSEYTYFPDLYYLELIRFKHPLLLRAIFSEKENIFEDVEYYERIPITVDYYNLATLNEKDGNPNLAEETKLAAYLQKRLHYSIQDTTAIYRIFITITRKTGNVNYDGSIPGYKGFLTFKRKNKFDRYFDGIIERYLPNQYFTDLLLKVGDELEKAIHYLSENESRLSQWEDFLIKYENLTDRASVEKFIQLYVRSGNLTLTPSLSHSRFNSKLGSLILDPSIQRLFESEAAFKAKILELLQFKDYTYTYTDNFWLHFVQFSQVSNPSLSNNLFTQEELYEMIISRYEGALKSHSKFSEIEAFYFNYYNVAEPTQSSKPDTYDFKKAKEIHKSRLPMTRDFFMQKDLDALLLKLIKQTEPGQYLYRFNIEFVNELFGSEYEFLRLLNDHSGDSKYKEEFIKFIREIPASKTVEKSYFKVIPVREQ